MFNAVFVFETFSVSRVILLSWFEYFHLVAWLLSWKCTIILLTVGTVDFEKKKQQQQQKKQKQNQAPGLLTKHIGVSLLFWSPIRKSRIKVLINQRIVINICSEIIKNYEQLSSLFRNFKHFFKNSSTIWALFSMFWALFGEIFQRNRNMPNGYAKFWGLNEVHYGLCEDSIFNGNWAELAFAKPSGIVTGQC